MLEAFNTPYCQMTALDGLKIAAVIIFVYWAVWTAAWIVGQIRK